MRIEKARSRAAAQCRALRQAECVSPTAVIGALQLAVPVVPER